MQNEVFQNMGRVFWAIVWLINIAIILSLVIDYGKPFIEFIYFVTSWSLSR